jgi:hypothetical protein
MHCEMCELACMKSAKGTKCERCAHTLGSSVDLTQLREEVQNYKRQIWAGVTLVVAMLVLNWMILQGAGGLLLIAPLGWVVWGYRELRIRKVYLSRAESSRR